MDKTISPAKHAYYEGEAHAARTPGHPAHLNPPIPEGARVLCMGCGGGWEGEAQGARRFVGVDIDEEAGLYRRLRGAKTEFRLARGESLPFQDGEFDYYVARVSLMYTNIPRALAEARRVLVRGSGLWITCHSFAHEWRHFVGNVRAGALRAAVYRAYVLLNGAYFHCTGRTVAFPLNRRRVESFQTRTGMRRALLRAGFDGLAFSRTGRGHMLVTAQAAPVARARSLPAIIRRYRVPVLFAALLGVGEEVASGESAWAKALRPGPVLEFDPKR